MQTTNSWSFPNLFDISRNRVAVKEGNDSITNRSRLLILTEPTELYNSPTFGVGLKRYLWRYNTANTKAIIQERIKSQLAEHEPCVEAESTQFADGLLFTESGAEVNKIADANSLKMTVMMKTIYQYDLELAIDLNAEREKMFNGGVTSGN